MNKQNLVQSLFYVEFRKYRLFLSLSVPKHARAGKHTHTRIAQA